MLKANCTCGRKIIAVVEGAWAHTEPPYLLGPGCEPPGPGSVVEWPDFPAPPTIPPLKPEAWNPPIHTLPEPKTIEQSLAERDRKAGERFHDRRAKTGLVPGVKHLRPVGRYPSQKKQPGRPPSGRKPLRANFRMTVEDRARLDRLCKATGENGTTVFRKALAAYEASIPAALLEEKA